MKLKDNYNIPMMSHDSGVSLKKPDVYVSIKDFCSYIANSKAFRKTLIKCLTEDGILPEYGD